MNYYILSLTHLDPDHYIWWRSNAAGYCTRLDWAGKYTEEEINDPNKRYNDGINTKAIPCDEVDKVAIKSVPREINLGVKM